MKKFKFIFIFSLLFIFLISLSSISAEDISSNDCQIVDSDINEDIIALDQLDDNDDLLSNEESDDQLDDDALSLNDESISDQLLDDDENIIDDSEIANDINVSFPHKIYQNDTGEISIEMPEDASGYIRVTIDEVEIYNETITDKSVRVPITIPKPTYPLIVVNRNSDYMAHKVAVYYNEISLDFDNILKIMMYKPEDGFFLNVPQEVLKDDKNSYQSFGLIFPYSANGTVDIYIDDVLFESANATQYLFLNISKINSMSLGTHTIRANFSGDDYYLPCSRNTTFNVVDFLVQIPKNVSLDHDDCIYAKSVKYTDGTLTVLFDGKVIFSKKLDKNHEFLESLFSKVTCGEHLIEVKYNSPKFNYTKQQTVNITYTVDIFGSDFQYGHDNSVNVIVPPDFNPKLVNITIDNKQYPVKIDNSGWIDLNISKLTAGNHTLVFNFTGDEKYYSHYETYNFTIFYGFDVPDFIEYLDGSVVSLTLPSTAKGNLEVYMNGTLYKSVKLVDGKASIRVDNLKCGEHEISLNYTGDDFELENTAGCLYIYPKINSPYEMECGKDKSIVVEVSKDSKGKIVFTVGKDKYEVQIQNGKAVLSLKNFKIGEYDIDVDYIGDDGLTSSWYTYVDVVPAKIRITGAKNVRIPYTSNSYYKVKVYDKQSKLAKGVLVNFKVGKTTYKVKTDKNGVAKLKLSKFAPKTYKITISYQGTKVSKKLTVKHIVSLNKVKIRKSAKKLTLTARLKKVNGKYLKGKVVKFRFNGKTFSAKTNSKGVAKVSIKSNVLKKLKVGKKITYKATYLKDSAKRTVKISK